MGPRPNKTSPHANTIGDGCFIGVASRRNERQTKTHSDSELNVLRKKSKEDIERRLEAWAARLQEDVSMDGASSTQGKKKKDGRDARGR
ncbi:hypothetical protein MTO96_023351 [Rhipicephalus appendiculatus]